MADLIDDVKTKLSTTSMSDVVTGAKRMADSAERGLRSGVDSAKRFVSRHVPESLKEIYRRERGYTVRKPTSGRNVTGKR